VQEFFNGLESSRKPISNRPNKISTLCVDMLLVVLPTIHSDYNMQCPQ
jgi:hypothetical protein